MQKDALQVGDIFNKIYYGTNEAYGRVNGKTTNILTKIDGDKIEYRTFYSVLCTSLHPQQMGNTTFWKMSSLMNSDYAVIKIQNPETEGFIHKKVIDLEYAANIGLVEKKYFAKLFRNKNGDYIRENPIMHHSFVDDKGNTIRKASITVAIEPFTHPLYPHLTRCLFVYDSANDLYNDVDRVFGIECWHFR
jgi:hypothetical protein